MQCVAATVGPILWEILDARVSECLGRLATRWGFLSSHCCKATFSYFASGFTDREPSIRVSSGERVATYLLAVYMAGDMAKALGRLTLVALLLVAARAQLVLDDVVEDPGQEQAPAVLEQRPAGATGITDPTTKLLQWSVDNMDHSDGAARAQAIREGKADPKPIDREAIEALFQSKVSYLQGVVEMLTNAIKADDADKLVEALEELENQARPRGVPAPSPATPSPRALVLRPPVRAPRQKPPA